MNKNKKIKKLLLVSSIIQVLKKRIQSYKNSFTLVNNLETNYEKYIYIYVYDFFRL